MTKVSYIFLLVESTRKDFTVNTYKYLENNKKNIDKNQALCSKIVPEEKEFENCR